MRDPRDVIVRPVVSEKSHRLMEEGGVYTFVVHPEATKTEIKQAVERIFSVHVTSVNTLNRKGKRVRSRQGVGRRADTKRALVTLRGGDKIGILEGR